MDKGQIKKDSIKSTEMADRIVLYPNTQNSLVYSALTLKLERIVSALHLVTGLMDSREILRDKIRKSGLDSINDLYDISDTSNDRAVAISDKIFDRISHMLSLLEVGVTSGLISEMNYKILKTEYIKLNEALGKINIARGVNSYLLPADLLGSDLRDTSSLSLKSDIGSLDKVGDKYRTDSKSNTSKVFKPNLPAKNSRQDIIMDVIKVGEEYTIKDIISGILSVDSSVDCSEKTIQRDILTLVATGRLNKRGERRWSRYSRK